MGSERKAINREKGRLSFIWRVSPGRLLSGRSWRRRGPPRGALQREHCVGSGTEGQGKERTETVDCFQRCALHCVMLRCFRGSEKEGWRAVLEGWHRRVATKSAVSASTVLGMLWGFGEEEGVKGGLGGKPHVW